MRKALVIGVDYYTNFKPLKGCVADARSVAEVLERHFGGAVNFATPKLLLAADHYSPVNRDVLRQSVKELFEGDAEIALLYFAGHGHIEETGGFLCASDCRDGHEGLPLSDVMTWATASKAKNKIVILDSCHGGIIGDGAVKRGLSEIGEGMTILTASTAEQYAYEGANGAPGIFTNLLIDALDGAAANLVGDVTPGSIYAHIDQSLGPWAQRPVFKTNVQTFVSLRKAEPPIPLEDLRALATHFPSSGYEFKLDPAYEPERSEEQKKDQNIPMPDLAKTEIFAVLQRYVRVNLVRPGGASRPHMWHAAMESKWCKLTVLGEHYRDLVAKKLI
ncbi:caspase family protein [Tardiphaga sp. 619_E2_N8_5]|uniref:caspase family protein n=1 Tax=unclassified Tardiphaga TaxID=2631404 RepID=UPI003F2230DD